MSLFGDLPPPQKDDSISSASFESEALAKESAPQLLNLDEHRQRQLMNNNIEKSNLTFSEQESTSISIKEPHNSPAPIAGKKRYATNDASTFSPSKKVSIGLSSLQSYVAERKGERAEMQDAHVLMDDCTNKFPQFQSKIKRVAYYAVFDGHGGHRASQHCAVRLHEQLIENLPKYEVSNFAKEMKKMILQSFKLVDEEFLKEASSKKPVWKDGTTVCSVLILDDTMYIMNLGDSKAILCRYNAEQKKHISISLSKDHNPTDYDERQRIQKAGGHVRDGRLMGILEVSRSIGDGQYKRCGVINVPDVKRCQFTCNDRFLLIACDGLWKVYNPEQAIDFILHVLQDNSIQVPEDSVKTLEETRFEAACNKLASEAVRRGSADNVTVLLVSVCKL